MKDKRDIFRWSKDERWLNFKYIVVSKSGVEGRGEKYSAREDRKD